MKKHETGNVRAGKENIGHDSNIKRDISPDAREQFQDNRIYLLLTKDTDLSVGSDTSAGISGNMSEDSGNSKETAGKNNTSVDVQCGYQADDINGQNVRSDDVVN